MCCSINVSLRLRFSTRSHCLPLFYLFQFIIFSLLPSWEIQIFPFYFIRFRGAIIHYTNDYSSRNHSFTFRYTSDRFNLSYILYHVMWYLLHMVSLPLLSLCCLAYRSLIHYIFLSHSKHLKSRLTMHPSPGHINNVIRQLFLFCSFHFHWIVY